MSSKRFKKLPTKTVLLPAAEVEKLIPHVKKNKPIAPTSIYKFKLYKNIAKTLKYIKNIGCTWTLISSKTHQGFE